tara:strand:+ start:2447 stop:3121 length:675 start_codon:yes stop_codon:yes gene_type:complete
MWPFEDKKVKGEISNLKTTLQSSFTNVKSDTQSIFHWIDYLQKNNEFLQKKADENDKKLTQVLDKLENIPTSPNQIKEMIDKHYDSNFSDQRLDAISNKIESWSTLNNEKMSDVFQKLELINQRVDKLESTHSKPRQSFKEKIIKKIQKSSKEYVKNLILTFIHKYDKISALKLREIVVEEQGLCSKSSFYRILEEIEQTQDDLSVLQRGKEKIFMSKLHRKQV